MRSAPLAILISALILGASIPAPAAAADPTAAARAARTTAFSRARFEEVLAVVGKHYIDPDFQSSRLWAAAAIGALAALHSRQELVTSSFAAISKFRERRFGGRSTPLICAGKPVPGVVLHTIPKRQKGEKPYGAGDPNSSKDPVADALIAWKETFTRAHFDCVVQRVLAQVGPVDPSVRRGRLVAQPLAPEVSARRVDELWRTAARNALRVLDPHSRLTTPTAWARVNQPFSTVLHIGVTFRHERGRVLIADVEAETEAAAQGLLVGDELKTIDGKPIKGLPKPTLERLLTRKPGAKARLGFLRAGMRTPIEVVLTWIEQVRADVEVRDLPAVKGARLIRLSKFAPGGAQRVVDAALGGSTGTPADALLLDMRGNPGGILPEAIALVGHLLGGGFSTRVQTRDGTSGAPINRAKRQRLHQPLVVLVDHRCASACELLTAALRDHHRAIVVGERTWGKATLQEYLSLPSGRGRVMITVAMFHAPSSRPIQARGVPPHVPIGPDGKAPIPHRREENLPFHLEPKDEGPEREPHPDLDAVLACAAKPIADADPMLARALTILRCLAAREAAFGHTHAGGA